MSLIPSIAEEALAKSKNVDCRSLETRSVNFKISAVDKKEMIKSVFLIAANKIDAFEDEIRSAQLEISVSASIT